MKKVILNSSPLLVVSLLSLAVAFGGSQADARSKSCSPQINFLNKFLKLENAGARLKSTGRIYNMTDDESHWDTATVVKTYALESCELNGKDAKITVSFQVLGTMASSPSGEPDFVQESKTEYVDFNVSRKNHHWQVVDLGDFRPHVSSYAAAHSIDPSDGKVAQRAIASLKIRKGQ